MARIRTIKPEFFDSPGTAGCSPWARLLYIAMWCIADDWGVGSANLKELAGFAFPNDDEWTSKELPCLCKEVADNYGAVFYTHRGRRYFAIPSWDEHQVTQRRAKRRYPAADDPESVPDKEIHGELGTSETSQGTSLSTQGKRKYGTGEQGNRGTGEKTPSSADADAAFEKWWKHYPRKVDKGHAKRAFRSALKKTDIDTLTAAVVAFAESTRSSDPKYIAHASTWLNGERWADESTGPDEEGWKDSPLPPPDMFNYEEYA